MGADVSQIMFWLPQAIGPLAELVVLGVLVAAHLRTELRGWLTLVAASSLRLVSHGVQLYFIYLLRAGASPQPSRMWLTGVTSLAAMVITIVGLVQLLDACEEVVTRLRRPPAAPPAATPPSAAPPAAQPPTG